MGEIVLDGITKEFPGGVRAVDGVDMTIEEGEFMVLVGPSGCGKTTLLRSIGGLESVTSGRILIDGKDVTKAQPSERDLAMVFQNYALYPHMTVRQNLGYALRVRKLPKKEINRRVEEAAKLLGLDGLLDRRPGALSGGQMQRVAMGRAIVREPTAFLMDEPLSNLDAKLRVTMRTSLQQLHRRIGTTTVYVTHDQVEAMTLGHRVAVMRLGKVQQVDVPARLYDEPANLFVAAFIGSPAMNLVNAEIEHETLVIGSIRIPLDRARRPVESGDRLIAGIRPEAFEDAAFAARDLPTIDVEVEVLESIGSDAYVFFRVDATPVIVEDALSDDADEDGSLLAEESNAALFAARVDARTKAAVGERITLAVDPSRVYYFSPETGESLIDRSLAGATA
ncbi:MAG TPA: sn-glycerol-3-phosphate ABC transporter ATP-binding protein UgpC [Gaiellaceae bacterium]|jgi:multiple sugar transport system ATP-binding protein|nr:sn-glycerol-3-phosphate ABC transporter ATP-binding protein UgpC [Gaiellaceae bacterium]